MFAAQYAVCAIFLNTKEYKCQRDLQLSLEFFQFSFENISSLKTFHLF